MRGSRAFVGLKLANMRIVGGNSPSALAGSFVRLEFGLTARSQPERRDRLPDPASAVFLDEPVAEERFASHGRIVVPAL